MEEGVQGSAVKNAEVDKSQEEEEIAAVPLDEKVLEDSQASVLKKKVDSDKVEELKKAKRPKKVLKKSKKKVEEVQSSAAKKGEEDKSNEEEEIDDALVLEKVVQDSQASVIERKVASHKVEESKKAKGPKKVLNKKLKKTVEAVQGGGKKEGEDKAKEEEEISAVSMVGKVLEVTQSSVLKRKIGLDKEEELKKAKRFKKVLKKSSKKVEEVQSSAAKKGEEDKSNEEEEIDDALVLEKVVQDSQASVIEWKVASHKVEESKKAKGPKKVLNKKLKKTVEAVQGGGKKEGEDKAKEEEEISAVSVVGKVLEVTQSSVLKRKIGLDKEEELKKSKRFKKVLKKSSKKAEEVQSSAAKKYDVEVPELLQASIRPVTEDSQNEEVTFCPERATESVAALPKVAKVVNKSEVGEPTKKASSSDLVHQKEKLEEEELKKAKRPKKILKKIKKKVEVVQGSGAQKEGGDKSEVEDIVAVSMVEEILEDSYGSLLKRKLVLDTVEEPQKTKRPKKLLKKLKKKVEEVQGSAPKQEEEDKSEV
ncbi:hypothetical protein MKW98_020263 [Papaver atlanticum]|uniref:Uncharacterized protein n=1 Tax=Papaver atlanticum TaxID=357466 RepID=A0AAD4TEC5_9MAGN|nr:hypothetical protein MKW98_020263 [Papaver atlanticum]